MTTTNLSWRYAPSRFYLPLSKLIAFALLRRDTNQQSEGRYAYALHSERSPIEAPAISIFVAIFTYVFWVALFRSWGASWLLTAAGAIVLGTFHWTASVAGVGVVIGIVGGWSGNRLKLQTAAMFIATAAMSLFMLTRGRFYAAWGVVWLLFLALNLVAWPITVALRGRLQKTQDGLRQ